MEQKWKIVKEDGNPEKEGIYVCVLIHEKMHLMDGKTGNNKEDWIHTGRKLAVQDSRWFGPATQNDNWLMKDQPKKGLAWHEECGSFVDEYVYAWLPNWNYPEIKLPDGVEWDNG